MLPQLFRRSHRGWDLARVRLRTPATRTDKNERLTARVEQVTPRLEGIEVDGRFIVLFSPYDISCALENHQSLECQGYIRADAARIGVNVILWYVVNHVVVRHKVIGDVPILKEFEQLIGNSQQTLSYRWSTIEVVRASHSPMQNNM